MSIRKFSRVVSDDSGASLVEYALIAALISVVAIGVLTTIGTGLTAKLGTVSTALQ